MLERVFPAEVAGNVPCITLRGKGSVCIEQHQGVITYRPEEVVFRTVCGYVKITGERLCFQVYTTAEAQVVGEISGVFLEKIGGAGK